MLVSASLTSPDFTIALRGKPPAPLIIPEFLASPLVLQLEPYVGEYALFIQISLATNLSIVGYPATAEKGFPAPRFIRHLENLPSQSFLVLIQEQLGYTCLLCLSHADQKAYLNPLDEGTLLLRAFSRNSSRSNLQRPVLVCTKGANPYQAIDQAMRLGLQLTQSPGKPLVEKSGFPIWRHTLGWNSRLLCGTSPSHDAIVTAVQSLHEEGYTPHYVIIDKGWQRLVINPKDRHLRPSLTNFDADKKLFPHGLKGLTESLQHLGVRHIGVWHAMMGATNGLHPDLARVYHLQASEQGQFFLGNDLGKSFEFYCDYYEYLRAQGVSFAQVGDQICATPLIHQNLQLALQAAASIHFNHAHLNTDCLRNENLFYWGTSTIARAAEDLDPANPVGVRRTIRNNLANALWLQSLMLPDLDVWRTDADPNDMLAVLHALSGSLLTIGDPPGAALKTTLQKLVLPSGKVVTADQPLTLCRDSIFRNPLEDKAIYKAFTKKASTGVVAAYNLCTGRHTLHGTVSSTDVEALSGERFAVFSHLHGLVAIVEAGKPVEIKLKPRQCDIFVFAPVIVGVAVLGCHLLYLPPGAITEVVIEEDSVHISSMIAAPLLLYCEKQVLEVRCNGHVLPWEHDAKRHLLSIDVRTHIEEVPSVYSITFEA